MRKIRCFRPLPLLFEAKKVPKKPRLSKNLSPFAYLEAAQIKILAFRNQNLKST